MKGNMGRMLIWSDTYDVFLKEVVTCRYGGLECEVGEFWYEPEDEESLVE